MLVKREGCLLLFSLVFTMEFIKIFYCASFFNDLASLEIRLALFSNSVVIDGNFLVFSIVLFKLL